MGCILHDRLADVGGLHLCTYTFQCWRLQQTTCIFMHTIVDKTQLAAWPAARQAPLPGNPARGQGRSPHTHQTCPNQLEGLRLMVLRTSKVPMLQRCAQPCQPQFHHHNPASTQSTPMNALLVVQMHEGLSAHPRLRLCAHAQCASHNSDPHFSPHAPLAPPPPSSICLWLGLEQLQLSRALRQPHLVNSAAARAGDAPAAHFTSPAAR